MHNLFEISQMALSNNLLNILSVRHPLRHFTTSRCVLIFFLGEIYRLRKNEDKAVCYWKHFSFCARTPFLNARLCVKLFMVLEQQNLKFI